MEVEQNVESPESESPEPESPEPESIVFTNFASETSAAEARNQVCYVYEGGLSLI